MSAYLEDPAWNVEDDTNCVLDEIRGNGFISSGWIERSVGAALEASAIQRRPSVTQKAEPKKVAQPPGAAKKKRAERSEREESRRKQRLAWWKEHDARKEADEARFRRALEQVRASAQFQRLQFTPYPPYPAGYVLSTGERVAL